MRLGDINYTWRGLGLTVAPEESKEGRAAGGSEGRRTVTFVIPPHQHCHLFPPSSLLLAPQNQDTDCSSPFSAPWQCSQQFSTYIPGSVLSFILVVMFSRLLCCTGPWPLCRLWSAGTCPYHTLSWPQLGMSVSVRSTCCCQSVCVRERTAFHYRSATLPALCSLWT